LALALLLFCNQHTLIPSLNLRPTGATTSSSISSSRSSTGSSDSTGCRDGGGGEGAAASAGGTEAGSAAGAGTPMAPKTSPLFSASVHYTARGLSPSLALSICSSKSLSGNPYHTRYQHCTYQPMRAPMTSSAGPRLHWMDTGS